MDSKLVAGYSRTIDPAKNWHQRYVDPANEFNRGRKIAEMNFLRRSVVLRHRYGLEILLIVSILSLLGQFSWPGLVRWWYLPRPGAVGVDEFACNTLAEKFLVYLPEAYREKNSWPLVIFLHGSGARGHNPNILRDLAPLNRTLPAIIVVPHCLPSYYWEPDVVAHFVQHVVSKYPVDQKRVYAIGFSMGAYGTFEVAATYPEMFAAIVPISGGDQLSDAEALSSTPIWAFHGEADTTVPADKSELIVDAVRCKGGDARLTILPGAGHGIYHSVFKRQDLWEWLFLQRRK